MNKPIYHKADDALDQQKTMATISVKGNAERFASENYYETVHIANYHEALQDDNKNVTSIGYHELLAAEEELFIKRFKFDAPRSVREQFYRLKQERDITDFEIGLLKRTGALTIKDNKVSVNSGAWVFWLGLILFVFTILYCLLWITVYEYSNLKTAAKLIAEVYYELLFFALSWGIHRNFFKPHRIVKRIGAWA